MYTSGKLDDPKLSPTGAAVEFQYVLASVAPVWTDSGAVLFMSYGLPCPLYSTRHHQRESNTTLINYGS